MWGEMLCIWISPLSCPNPPKNYQVFLVWFGFQNNRESFCWVYTRCMFVCLYMYAFVCVYVCVPMEAKGVFLNCFLPYILKQGVSLSQELTGSARLACLQTPQIFLSLLSQYRNFRHGPLHPTSTRVLGVKLRSPCL